MIVIPCHSQKSVDRFSGHQSLFKVDITECNHSTRTNRKAGYNLPCERGLNRECLQRHLLVKDGAGPVRAPVDAAAIRRVKAHAGLEIIVYFQTEIESHGRRRVVRGLVCNAVGSSCRSMGKNPRHRALKIKGLVKEAKTGGIKNHTFSTEFERRARMAHTILARAQSVDLIAFCKSTKGSRNHEDSGQ